MNEQLELVISKDQIIADLRQLHTDYLEEKETATQFETVIENTVKFIEEEIE